MDTRLTGLLSFIEGKYPKYKAKDALYPGKRTLDEMPPWKPVLKYGEDFPRSIAVLLADGKERVLHYIEKEMEREYHFPDRDEERAEDALEFDNDIVDWLAYYEDETGEYRATLLGKGDPYGVDCTVDRMSWFEKT